MLDKLRHALGDHRADLSTEGPFEQPADAAGLVTARRRNRRIKAGLSIALALSAGTYLSCQRILGKGEQSPTPQQPQTDPRQPTRDAGTPQNPADAGFAPQSPADTGPPTRADASKADTTALERRKPTQKKKPKVDIREHRKGMPVPDNLLE